GDSLETPHACRDQSTRVRQRRSRRRRVALPNRGLRSVARNQFLAVDRHVGGRVNAESHPVPLGLEYFDRNAAGADDPLTGLAGENEHADLRARCWGDPGGANPLRWRDSGRAPAEQPRVLTWPSRSTRRFGQVFLTEFARWDRVEGVAVGEDAT